MNWDRELILLVVFAVACFLLSVMLAVAAVRYSYSVRR